MKVTRRTFVAATGALAVWPAFAGLRLTARRVPAVALPAVEADPGGLVFRIDGWNAHEQGALQSDDEAWLAIDRSFRGAWR